MNLNEVVVAGLREVVGPESPIWADVTEGDAYIFSSGTAESPEARPFYVVRWGVEIPGMGPVSQRPFEIWIYDEEGDYTRPNQIGESLNQYFNKLEAVSTDTGSLLQIEVIGRSGDFTDEGYRAVVVPMRYVAIASGI